MSNIENLTQKIELDAKKKASSILEEAGSESENIVSNAVSKAQKESDLIVKKASKEAENIVEKTLSSAELLARDTILRAKEEVVERVFSLAKERLVNLDSKKYFDCLNSAISDFKDVDNIQIIVPEKYYETVKNEIKNIEVVKDSNIDSGFNIKRGNIIYNNVFSSLIEANRSELEYEVSTKLFK